MIINSDQSLIVTLNWCGDIDLDLTAFMLGQNSLVMDDGGVVFYNSLSREHPYDEAVHGDPERWRRMCRPMSPDGAVVGSVDDQGSGEASSEQITIDLSRVDPKVRSVMLCVTSSVKEGRRPPIIEAEHPRLSIEGEAPLVDCDLSQLDDGACGYEAYELVRRGDGRWTLDEVDEYHEGGLVELFEKFV